MAAIVATVAYLGLEARAVEGAAHKLSSFMAGVRATARDGQPLGAWLPRTRALLRAEWLELACSGLDRGDAALLDEYAYTTFSQGLHRCPGQALALRTIECVVARLLVQRAALATRPLPPVSFERATLAQRAAPVAVRVSVDNVPYNVD